MIDIILDSSQIKTYLSCPRKWQYAHQEHLVPTLYDRSALDKGTCIHKLLEFYYKAKFDLPIYQAGQLAIDQFETSKEAELVDKKTRDFLIQRYRKYVLMYQRYDFDIPNKDCVEVGFSHVLYEDSYKRYILEGKIDLLTNSNTKELCIVDHKTQGRFFNLFPGVPQFKTYCIPTGARTGVINIIGLQDNDEGENVFRRIPFRFTEHQIESWKQKVIKVFDHVLIIETGQYESDQNFGECGGPFGSYPCVFNSLCELNPENTEMINNLKQFKYEKVVWSPWNVEEE